MKQFRMYLKVAWAIFLWISCKKTLWGYFNEVKFNPCACWKNTLGLVYRS